MRVATVRRYPVKSCGGEELAAVHVDRRGLVGDRLWAVVDEDGKLASGKDSRRFRRRDPVFDLWARLEASAPEVRFPDGGWVRVDDPGAPGRLAQHFDAPVTFAQEQDVDHMDGGRVSLVGTATLAAMAEASGAGGRLDPRRFRVNVVVATDEPWVEESWVGHDLRIGGVVLRPVRRIERCRMIDIAQDGVPAQAGLLKAVARERDLNLAVYADVVADGEISVGDAVTLVEETGETRPPWAGSQG